MSLSFIQRGLDVDAVLYVIVIIFQVTCGVTDPASGLSRGRFAKPTVKP